VEAPDPSGIFKVTWDVETMENFVLKRRTVFSTDTVGSDGETTFNSMVAATTAALGL